MTALGHNHATYIESLEAEAAELVAGIREKAARLEEIKRAMRAERRVLIDGVYTYDADGIDIQRELADNIRIAGSGKAFAEALGLSTSYIHDVNCSRRPVSDRVAAALGYEKVVGYRRIA